MDLAGYRLVASKIRCAISDGETFATAGDFSPFLNAGVMDVLQPDIAISGGLTGVSQVATLAEIHGRPAIPHVWGSIVNFQAALHLTSTLSAHRGGGETPFPFMEFDVAANPLLDLAGRPQPGQDGTIAIPDGPGLGIERRDELLEPFRIHGARLA